MSTHSSIRLPARARVIALAVALCSTSLPWSLAYAHEDREGFHDLRDADPQGSVEIVEIAGSVQLTGWDRPQIEISAQGYVADLIQVTTSASHISIRVNPHTRIRVGGDDDPHVVIHLPAKSAVSATLVTANVQVNGIDGDVTLRTVSGDVSGDVGGNLSVHTSTGNIRMEAGTANSIEIGTINGDVHVKGGSGAFEFSTVSGNAKIELASVTRARFKSISGDMVASLALAPDADLEGHSISGNMRFDFSSTPAADFEIRSFSGDIRNCFGPKPEQAHYGPGSRLEFKSGTGQGHVRIDTKSGDVHVCAAGAASAAKN